MLSFRNLTPRLEISPTNQVINGEPRDVEKDTRQATSSREASYGLSPNLKAGSHGSPSSRGLPIISGILIPFSILLSIPSLTGRWYIRTDANDVTLETRPNSLLLDVGMAFSMACGVLANICLVFRFAERNVLRMTLLCILFLTLHDLINISTVTIFGIQHRFNDGFTYGQSFWFTVCSTIASTATNITLIIDYSRTKDFVNSGSGLTHKQRSLAIIIIVLLCYLALGSLIQTFMLKIPFIDALYFSLVSIETIGFGDLHPTTTGPRIFTSFYIAGGILNLALAVVLLREVLLEGLALGFQARVKAIRTRQRERRIRTRWRTAVKLRLRDNNLPMWVIDSSGENDEQDWQYHYYHYWWRWANRGWNFLRKRLSCESAYRHQRKRKHLNLEALTEAQMEEAALEAGAPLADLLPPGLHLASSTASGDDMEGDDDEDPISGRGGVPFMHSMTMQDEASLQDTLVTEEKIAFATRLTVALLVFIVFWMAGSAIFMKTEEWHFGTAAYFCFITFTTVGYGDLSPRTPAGRSIFVAWALLGVATNTILISLLVEAYSSQFKSVIQPPTFPGGVNTIGDGSGTIRRIRFLESGVVNTGTKEELSAISPPFRASAIATSSRTGHRDWDPSIATIPEDGSQEHKKESVESLHEILRHAQSIRFLNVPENWLKDVKSNVNPADLGAPKPTPLSDVRGPRELHKICQIEKTVQEIITAARCALEVLDDERSDDVFTSNNI